MRTHALNWGDSLSFGFEVTRIISLESTSRSQPHLGHASDCVLSIRPEVHYSWPLSLLYSHPISLGEVPSLSMTLSATASHNSYV